MESSKQNQSDKFKGQRKAVLVRQRYTTRQMMEITELRRRQQELVRQADEISQESQAQDPVGDTEPVRDAHPAAPVESGRFLPLEADSDFTDSRQTADRVVERDSVRAFDEPDIADPGTPPRVVIPHAERRWLARPLAHLQSFLDYMGKALVDGLLTAGCFVLFTGMLAHIFSEAQFDTYRPAPFIVLAVFLSVWMSRRKIQKGQKSFGTGVLAFLLGLGVYAYAALNGFVYLEVLGFVAAAVGVLSARYSRAAEEQLTLPLLCLLFVIPPSTVLAPYLNHFVAGAAVSLLNALQVPASWNGVVVNGGGYDMILSDHSQVIRSVVIAVPLALLYAHHGVKHSFRKSIVVLMVVPLTLAASILHLAGTGWVAYNYGEIYGNGFYSLPGVILFFVMWLYTVVDSLFNEESIDI